MGFEFMLNALRLTGRLRPEPVRRAHRHADQRDRTSRSTRPRRKGLIYRDFKLIRPTELGQRFLNDLQEMFLGA